MIIVNLNLNDTVKVKLTPHGRKLAELSGYENTAASVDNEGFSSWQLWVLIGVLGEHLHPSADVAIEQNIIRIEARN